MQSATVNRMLIPGVSHFSYQWVASNAEDDMSTVRDWITTGLGLLGYNVPLRPPHPFGLSFPSVASSPIEAAGRRTARRRRRAARGASRPRPLQIRSSLLLIPPRLARGGQRSFPSPAAAGLAGRDPRLHAAEHGGAASGASRRSLRRGSPGGWRGPHLHAAALSGAAARPLWRGSPGASPTRTRRRGSHALAPAAPRLVRAARGSESMLLWEDIAMLFSSWLFSAHPVIAAVLIVESLLTTAKLFSSRGCFYDRET
ncbi:hypothetical protein GQ55_5G256300 [Panicum hallii var. hallii]|uniref:Uncharacterized protein n=1 Tax=Panicum hallii var. hallii TaxID=1504633 RepID=A0A2T7DK63_9POAL|nr:hypothetical protein GQ55_5G256300 [Panicum hallii var. hallii]